MKWCNVVFLYLFLPPNQMSQLNSVAFTQFYAFVSQLLTTKISIENKRTAIVLLLPRGVYLNEKEDLCAQWWGIIHRTIMWYTTANTKDETRINSDKNDGDVTTHHESISFDHFNLRCSISDFSYQSTLSMQLDFFPRLMVKIALR